MKIMDFMTMIIKKDYITNKDCDHLIRYYEDNLDKTFLYERNNTNPLIVKNSDNIKIKSILSKIENDFLQEYNAKLIDHVEIVKWPVSTKMENHTDHDNDKFAFILYLNDDYDGGETVIHDVATIKPEKGKLITFTGNKYIHGVNEIKNKDRYTMIGWCR